MTEHLPAVISPEPLSPAVVAAVESARAYIGSSIASNTQRAYAAQWRAFAAWCEENGADSLPAAPGTVAAYLASMADSGKKVATMDSARAAIRKAHEASGHPDPTAAPLVKQTLKGIRRQKGVAVTQKAPVLTADLRRMMAVIPSDTLRGKRDRAVLLVGFAGAFRRSELVALTVEDIQETVEGVLLTIRRSKTDQEGRGDEKGIERGEYPDLCPVSALLDYLRAAGITSGPVFRNIGKGGRVGEQLTAQSVALIVKASASAAKLDTAKYAGHSLRAGMVTQAAKNGVPVIDIMRQTLHRSTETVNRYVRKATIFEDNASGKLGL